MTPNRQEKTNKKEILSKDGEREVFKEQGIYGEREEKKLADSIKQDFLTRQEQRRAFEMQWLLNMNFAAGNQYCSTTKNGEFFEQDRAYFWQEKQIFNHIAPILDTRLARLSNIRPSMSVRPAGDSLSDTKASKMATKILSAVCERINLPSLIEQAESWSETCGTSFYKVSWDNEGGEEISLGGKSCKSGQVNVSVCSPFEIYPDNNWTNEVEHCESIIHAKAYNVDEIKRIWGKEVAPEEVEVLESQTAMVGGLGHVGSVVATGKRTEGNCSLVIEKYTAPCAKYPNGQLVTVAGQKVLFCGDLPYVNSSLGQRTYPFIRQVCLRRVGCFWGTSIVERLIPLQRSYNAVKNRKHEFLNRLSMGVLTVEDGSVDTDNLEEEGLCPGKILVYRSGSDKPTLMESGRVPSDFSYEEDRLLNEFIVISGVSELSRNSAVPQMVTSGVALQLLVEQDEARLSATANEVKNAVKQIGKHIIRLYRQFGSSMHRVVLKTNNSTETHYFYGNQLESDDVVFETENEISDSPANRRNIVMELLASGILLDQNGKMSNGTRVKVLEMLGFGNWEHARDLDRLHIKRAERENLNNIPPEVMSVDDHQLHINTHIAFLIDEENQASAQEKKKLLDHIQQHKEAALQVVSLAAGNQTDTLQDILTQVEN